MRCEEWPHRKISAYGKTSARVGVYYKLAAALVLMQTIERGALCTLFKFPILPMEQFVSHFEVLKQSLLMTQFH